MNIVYIIVFIVVVCENMSYYQLYVLSIFLYIIQTLGILQHSFMFLKASDASGAFK